MKNWIKYKFDDTINIYPIFDVHYGAYAHCADKFRKYIDIIKKDPIGYCILGGDLINNNIGKVGIPWDDMMPPWEQKSDMVELLRPIKDRILASVRGNHEYRTVKQGMQDSSRDIMSKLDLEQIFRPDIAIIDIGIGTKKHGKSQKPTSNVDYIIAVTHGAGGGIKPGATLNRAEDYVKSFDGLDVFLSGHTHKPLMEFARKTVLKRQAKATVSKDVLVCIASGWLDGTEGYPVTKMLPPTATCQLQRITLHLTESLPRITYYAEQL